ncbi:BLUF domain-containing protein [Puniceicoccaceae bacterium K14]|nr:BLUF domain-containing protein [Puniceicoccaceae bacterium K14]
MHLVVYISKFAGCGFEVDSVMADITQKSLINNDLLGITGVLFYHGGYFMQVIEGEKINVETLMSKLERDRRHTEVYRIVDEPIACRSFAKWKMDSFNLRSVRRIDPKKIRAIRDAYKRNYTMDSADLILFITMVLESDLYQRPSTSLA